MTFAPDWSDRFWSKVHPEALSGCWLWHGGTYPSGYPRFWFRGQNVSGTRHSYALANRAAPGDLFVCHRCDVPLCVNPEHLFLGTQTENLADMRAKGRARVLRGDEHPSSKLTAEKVRAARAMAAAGATQRALAASLGVTQAAISRVLLGKQWRHVA